MSGNKHIIAIRLSAMGDVAMTVPVLRAFILQNPDVQVTVVSREMFRPFFKDLNLGFFAADVKGRHKGLRGLIRLYKDLNALKVDAVADLHNVLRSKAITLLFSLSGKRTATIDKSRAAKKALTRIKDKVFMPLTAVPQKYASVFNQLGFVVDLSHPVFPGPKHLSSEVLEVTGQKQNHWIGIAPFAQHSGKIYPPDQMQQVIDSLASNHLYKLFLFGGGKTEKDALEKYAQGKENIVVVAGRMELEQELQLISNLDIMLSMDSGNAHIAAMLGINVVTLWGATHPYAGFAPFSQPIENALVSDREKYPFLPTSVYGNKHVEGYEDAMRTILPETVVSKINKIIKKG